ncbi:MAG: hypothetical protein AAFV49_01430 [Pseudomonadota bacterium]
MTYRNHLKALSAFVLGAVILQSASASSATGTVMKLHGWSYNKQYEDSRGNVDCNIKYQGKGKDLFLFQYSAEARGSKDRRALCEVDLSLMTRVSLTEDRFVIVQCVLKPFLLRVGDGKGGEKGRGHGALRAAIQQKDTGIDLLCAEVLNREEELGGGKIERKDVCLKKDQEYYFFAQVGAEAHSTGDIVLAETGLASFTFTLGEPCVPGD